MDWICLWVGLLRYVEELGLMRLVLWVVLGGLWFYFSGWGIDFGVGLVGCDYEVEGVF